MTSDPYADAVRAEIRAVRAAEGCLCGCPVIDLVDIPPFEKFIKVEHSDWCPHPDANNGHPTASNL